MKTIAYHAATFIAAYACGAMAATTDEDRKIGKLSVELGGIQEGKPIPAKFAFCQPDGRGHTKNGDTISARKSAGTVHLMAPSLS